MNFDYANMYKGIETADNFTTKDELADYRKMLLAKTKKQTTFIKKHINAKDFFEIGTGNGRLLIDLAENRLLENGYGIDISESRILFAKQWARDEHLDSNSSYRTSVEFEVADIIEYNSKKKYDGCICITGAFGYFEAIQKGNDIKILNNIFDNILKKNGVLLLELYNHSFDINRCLSNNQTNYRSWNYLSGKDPFRYFLHDFQFDEKNRILKHKKIFIRKDGWIDDSKYEELKIYSKEEIKNKLTEVGFKKISFFRNWDWKKYNNWDETMIILAK